MSVFWSMDDHGVRMTKAAWVLFIAIGFLPGFAHSQAIAQAAPQGQTGLTTNAQGQIVISEYNPWAVAMAVSAIRRHFGLVIDYEESLPDPSEVYHNSGDSPQLRARTLHAVLPPPHSRTTAAILAMLRNMARQVSTPSQVVKVGMSSKDRFNVFAQAPGQYLLLDTLIALPKKRRTVATTALEICEAAAEANGVSCGAGRFAIGENGDNYMSDVGSDRPVKARRLLTEVLDAAPFPIAWVIEYVPSIHSFAIFLEPAP